MSMAQVTDTKPKVVIIGTGGTIAGVGNKDPKDPQYDPGELLIEALLETVPGIGELAAVSGEQLSYPGKTGPDQWISLPSSYLTEEHWLILSKRINEVLRNPHVHGIVVTHGTDALEETAYFLHLTVNSEKPVVMVGAMRPSTTISADGPMNIFNAVALAASPQGRNKGVMVVMNDSILPARDVRKMNTERTHTFAAPNWGASGSIRYGNIEWIREPNAPYLHTYKLHHYNPEFDVTEWSSLPRIEVLSQFAGSRADVIDFLKSRGTQAFVFAGAGQGALSRDVTEYVISDSSTIYVRSSRTGSGRVSEMKFFQNTLYSELLSPHKAKILLQVLFAVGIRDKAMVQEYFERA